MNVFSVREEKELLLICIIERNVPGINFIRKDTQFLSLLVHVYVVCIYIVAFSFKFRSQIWYAIISSHAVPFICIGNWGPILVVSQDLNVLKWETELKCWCPALKILLYLGNPGVLFLKRQVLWNIVSFTHVLGNISITQKENISLGHGYTIVVKNFSIAISQPGSFLFCCVAYWKNEDNSSSHEC